MDLEQLQDDVFDKLNMLDVTQLGECCVQLNQVVPPNKKGKKSGTRDLLFTYFHIIPSLKISIMRID